MSNRPHWFREALQAGDVPIAREVKKVWNRTGAAVVVGGIYSFDLTLSSVAAESSANSQGIVLPAVTNWYDFDNGSAWRNAVAPVTATLRTAIYGVALQAVADNEEFELLTIGPTTLVAGLTAINGSIPIWSTWTATNASHKATATTSPGSSRIVFLNTAAVAGDGTNVTTTVTGWFNGYGF